VFTFPEDAKTSTGSLFWSPPKRWVASALLSSEEASALPLSPRLHTFSVALPTFTHTAHIGTHLQTTQPTNPARRFPTPLIFDAADPAHAAFVQAAAILKAQVGALH
jgi:hypothetical protein